VEPAQHEGTFKVRSRVTGTGVADITLKDKNVDFDVIKGINYSTLDFQEGEAQRILDNPEFRFRHNKDRDTLQRIEVFKQAQKKRKSRKSRNSNPYWKPIGGVIL
jgi:orotate phosphoribosyltransferase-like protein